MDIVERYRLRRYERLLERLDSEDDGEWITIHGTHIHLNEEGVPDAGPRDVLRWAKLQSKRGTARGGVKSVDRSYANSHSISIDETVRSAFHDAIGVNPYIGTSIGKQNCGSCSMAFELKRRGMMVVAKGFGLSMTDLGKYFGLKYDDYIFTDGMPEDKVADFINDTLTRMPVGSRGVVGGNWIDGGGGHMFNFEVCQGYVQYTDAQNPDSLKYNTSDYIAQMRKNDIIIARLDNKPIVGDVLEVVDKA